MIAEMIRIHKNTGHEPTMDDWDRLRGDGYPYSTAVARAWGSWIDFQNDMLKSERITAPKLSDCTLPTKGLPVSSVRVVGKEVYYMLR
jgi:hypothetical protein